jgi:hypothetical protein
MSLLIPDTGVFEYVHQGLKRVAYNLTADALYCFEIYNHFKDKDTEAEALRLVKSWAYLNELSYSVGYNMMDEPFTSAQGITGKKYYTVEPAQLFKYIHCINYNIDVKTIDRAETLSRKTGPKVANVPEISWDQRQDAKLLHNWYIGMAIRLAELTPGYEEALYSDEPRKVLV